MVKFDEKNEKNFYQCEECGFLYEKEETAQKCEEWCRAHKSCNLEIIKEGIPPRHKSMLSESF